MALWTVMPAPATVSPGTMSVASDPVNVSVVVALVAEAVWVKVYCGIKRSTAALAAEALMRVSAIRGILSGKG